MSVTKILPLEIIAERLAALRATGKTIVQCHGCFDLMHIGHIKHLQAAKRMGDTLVVTRADRIARSAAHLLTTVQDLKKKGVAVRFLDQPELNTEGKYADFLLTVLAAVAQLERDIMDEKRRDGIAAARANGVKFGRPRLVSTKLQVEAKALKQSGIAMPEIARRLNLGVSTIYRLLAEQKEREGA